MLQDIKEIVFTKEDIQKKVNELASRITSDYKGKDLIVVGILKGSVLFMVDLLKEINLPCKIDFMMVSSYGNSTESSGKPKIIKDLEYSIENKDILIVEDIIDSGITLEFLLRYLKDRKANSVEIVTLLNKTERRKADVSIKYSGFKAPNEFLVGYGMDYAEKYRNLPFIGVLKPEIYE